MWMIPEVRNEVVAVAEGMGARKYAVSSRQGL
jgi:hypothetical protein